MSVVMPVHDGAELLPAAIASILRQTFQDFDVVIAGDGADATLEETARSIVDPRVRWRGFPKAPGFGYSNRARAIQETTGELIAYLAPDDLWGPNHLQHLVAAVDADRLDFVFSRPVLVWAGGQVRPHYLPFDLCSAGIDPPGFLLTCVSPTHVLHTRSILERAGGWTDALRRHGDMDLWLRCRAAGARFGFVDALTTVRLPSYAFKGESAERVASLHSRLADDLASGQLSLETLRWPPVRRWRGWIEDVLVVGRARGPRWAAALVLRHGH